MTQKLARGNGLGDVSAEFDLEHLVTTVQMMVAFFGNAPRGLDLSAQLLGDAGLPESALLRVLMVIAETGKPLQPEETLRLLLPPGLAKLVLAGVVLS